MSWMHSLIKIWLWHLEVSTVSNSLDCEDERFSSEHSQLAHHLSREGHKQTDGLLLVNHSLVDVQTTRQDKVQTDILLAQRGQKRYKRRQKRNSITIKITPFVCIPYMLLYSVLKKEDSISQRDKVVPGPPVGLRQLQLLHCVESICHLTGMRPGFRQMKIYSLEINNKLGNNVLRAERQQGMEKTRRSDQNVAAEKSEVLFNDLKVLASRWSLENKNKGIFLMYL